jgi:golgin subfamily B member 1
VAIDPKLREAALRLPVNDRLRLAAELVQSVANGAEVGAVEAGSTDVSVDVSVEVDVGVSAVAGTRTPVELEALRKQYVDSNQYDKAWCVCATLMYLGNADADERQFYEQYKPRGLVKAKHAMTEATWAHLRSPSENRHVSAVLGACWQSVATFKAFPHKDFDLKRKHRRDLANDGLLFSKLFHYVGLTMNVPLPEVFLVEDNKASEMQLANAIDKQELCPAFVVRPHLLQGKNEREIAFLCARRLAFMRREYYLKMLLPTNTEIKVALLSAITMVDPRFPVPQHLHELVQRYRPEMQKRMPTAAIEPLRAVTEQLILAGPELDMVVWARAVDAASDRAGLVVCGDLDVATRMIRGEAAEHAKERIDDLVQYSVSEPYFAVRSQMGLTIAG